MRNPTQGLPRMYYRCQEREFKNIWVPNPVQTRLGGFN